MGMVLHELATNAAKYGAVSVAGGRVDVSWHSADAGSAGEQRLYLTWTERGGPPVSSTGPAGFGTSFITRSVAYELGGTAALELAPEGLRCAIEFPLRGNVEQSSIDRG
jgi:two-component sensor histidine kinase